MGMCVTASSSAKRKHHLLSRQQQHIKRLLTEPVMEDEQITGTHQFSKSSDFIGDNIDITRSPSQMSVERRRQSWHWFLLVALEKRVQDPTLDDTHPIADISQVENSLFIPNLEESAFLEGNFIYLSILFRLSNFKKFHIIIS